MIKDGVLKETAINSPLASASLINPERNGKEKKLVAAVILTSLIDAFSILVIYLLVNFSTSGEILYLSKDMILPSATESEALIRTTLVKIEDEQIYLEDKPVDKNQLVASLVDLKKQLVADKSEQASSLTVQADKEIKYKLLNEIVLAGSHAGFSEIKFAVLAK